MADKTHDLLAEATLHLTLQRDLSVPDWNEKTGNAVYTVFLAGTEVTIPLVLNAKNYLT